MFRTAFSVVFSVGLSTRRAMTTGSRGALIVLEGGDRCGKSTQSKKLVQSLRKFDHKAIQMSFPDRTTSIGKMISAYLENKSDLDDHVVHLLFSANRWELVPKMKTLLESGTSLIVDRYAFSGVAFTAAKSGMDLDWCRQPDVGLPRPDLVLYLNMAAKDAAQRGGFGDERYESQNFQNQVTTVYEKLFEDNWVMQVGQ
ncbi:thymidylate kinase-like isoform X2 [Tubulanus polymorphus]|uniref:thymidylate kinase-like isoform X2 n=1 Tax=Tubulanus polymorphus TaxID=672921 RepID=UPI003DA32837